MLRAIVILLVALTFRTVPVEHTPAPQATYYGGSEMDSPAHSVVLEDGSILVTGSTRSTDGPFAQNEAINHNNYAFAVMFGPDGNVRWQLVYSKGYGDNQFRCSLPQADGTFVLVYDYYVGDMQGIILMTVSDSGEVLHETEVPKENFASCYPLGGNLLIQRVGGMYYLPEWDWYPVQVSSLECVNPQGEVLWRHTYPEITWDGLQLAILVAEDGYYLAGGRYEMVEEHLMVSRAWTAKLDTGGNMLWYKELETGYSSSFNAIQPRADGDVLVAGYYIESESAETAGTVAWVDADGTIGRTQNYLVGQHLGFSDMLPSGDGYLLMGNHAFIEKLPMVLIDASGHIIQKWNMQTPHAEPMQSARLYQTPEGYAIVAMAHVEEETNVNNGDIVLMPVVFP